MSKFRWIIFAVISVGILMVLVLSSKSTSIDISDVDVNSIQTANEKNGEIADHVFGNVDSKVTLIEYGDFQCPPCGSAHPVIKNIIELYKDQIKFVFRNFPITGLHPNAMAASGAAEAAGIQGKYWEMHDKIYESQSSWSNLTGNGRTDFFTNYAKELGLDINKFNDDIASQSVTDKINYDYNVGKKANVTGTPMFYLNGSKIDAETLSNNDKLKEAINAELTKAGVNDLPK